ncbi:MAG TPA: hypothetical protein VJU53_01120 [Burkholderiaceae bacterium]|nr:hypothetical protein [Burkholderiaceae bacterium]
MKVDFGLRPAGSIEKNRREHMWRVVKAVVGSMVAGGAGLIFGFAMGLHDARWSDVWTRVGYASSAFSTQSEDSVVSRG